MFDPKIHHRRSIRLKGFDYASPGKYFITICCNQGACLFGSVAGDEMILNDAGSMIDRWWQKVPGKFPDMALDVYQIMPKHFHAIIINTGMVDACHRADPPQPEVGGRGGPMILMQGGHVGPPLPAPMTIPRANPDSDVWVNTAAHPCIVSCNGSKP